VIPLHAVAALNAWLLGSVPAGWGTSLHPLAVFMRSDAAPLHDELRGGEQEDHGNSVVQWL